MPLFLTPCVFLVVYFVTGRKAWNPGEAVSIWAYEDSFIKVAATATFVPSCMKEARIYVACASSGRGSSVRLQNYRGCLGLVLKLSWAILMPPGAVVGPS